MSRYRCIQRMRVNWHQPVETILHYAKKYAGAFDAVALIVPPFRQEAHEAYLQSLASCVAELQKNGIGAQINVGFSIGHGDVPGIRKPLPGDPLPNDVLGPWGLPFQTMVDATGTGCLQSACPRDEAFVREFVQTCASYARTGAEVLWLDDDMRMQNHAPVQNGCFCDACVARFNALQGTAFARESLVQALLKDHYPRPNALRLAWLHYNHDALVDLTRAVARAVFAVNPSMGMGHMPVGVELTVYDLPDYASLGAPMVNAKGQVYYRPGGLFWNDGSPTDLIHKAFRIARQNAWSIQEGAHYYSEHCINPYTKRSKSMRINALEAVAHIAMGGAHGIMPESIDGNLEEQSAFLSLMDRMRPFLSALSDALEGYVQTGFLPYCHPEQWAYNDAAGQLAQMKDCGSTWAYRLLEAGIPLTAYARGALGVILCGGTVKAMPGEELAQWLRKGVYADGVAAGIVEQRLGAQALGVHVTPYDPSANVEFFTEDVLNQPFTAFRRRPVMADDLRGSADLSLTGARALTMRSRRMAYREEAMAGGLAGMSVMDTAQGGRACVCAHKPWAADILSNAKLHQINGAFAWLCGGKLPVRIHGRERIAQSLWEREGQRICALFVLDFDDASDVWLELDEPMRCERLNADGSWEWMGEGDALPLPVLPAWSHLVLRMTRDGQARKDAAAGGKGIISG